MSIRMLSSELQFIAKNELNEDSSKIEECIREIRKWIATQDHLNVRPENQWILIFLRGCKYNLEKVKRKIDAFYTAKTLIPELLQNRDPFLPEIQELLELGVCIPLRKTLNSNRSAVVFLLHYQNINTQTVHILDIIKVIIMSIDIILNECDNFVVVGHKAVEDLKDFSLTHMLQVSPSNAKKIFTCFQEAYPIRQKVAHFINPPSFFKYLYAFVKPFMGKKLRDRIKLYDGKDMTEMYDDIPRSILPIEYGGEDGSIRDMAVEWKKKVESYRDWFLDDAKYCSDESKRGTSSSWSLWRTLFGN